MRRALFFYVIVFLFMQVFAFSSDDPLIMYIEYGENCLLAKQYNQAYQSISEGKALLKRANLSDSERQDLEFRSELGMMLAASALGDEEQALKSSQIMRQKLQKWDCNRLSEPYHKDEEYVIGPDKAPYRGWCSETVNSTSIALKLFVQLCPLSTLVKETIVLTIDQAQSKALQCCRNGGIWKACVGPLARKLYEWKVLGVTPDPAWD